MFPSPTIKNLLILQKYEIHPTGKNKKSRYHECIGSGILMLRKNYFLAAGFAAAAAAGAAAVAAAGAAVLTSSTAARVT